MCTKPDIPDPQKFQTSKTPTYRDSADKGASGGRRGTILTGGSGITETQGTSKKVLLGQ